MNGRCLGKQPVRIDKTIPSYRWIFDGTQALPSSPIISEPILDNVSFWPVLGNDTLSNCTIATALHQVQLWTAMNNRQIVPDLDCAIAGYAHATGYDPATGAHDDGAVEIDILRYWMVTGLPISANSALDRLDGYAVIAPLDLLSLTHAISLFGTVYAGVELPTSADAEFAAGQAWASLADAPGSLGGHAVPLIGTRPEGILCVTWGRVQLMTWDWWRKYASESYAVLRREWIGARGISPSGMTMAQLDAKITAIRGTLGLGAYA